jgi:type II secretory pathway pseudopilin PulG
VASIRRAEGFTYVALIILVAIIGLVGALTLKADSLMQRAAAEEELLDIGAAFSAALQSYAAVTPQGQPQQPPSLQDLLKDPRFPEPRRHLRKIFVDPVTGKAQWGVVYLGEQKGVVAVYSLSQAKPLKVGNFDARFANFDNKEHISDWKFTANAQGLTVAGEAAGERKTIMPADPAPPKQEPQVQPPTDSPSAPEEDIVLPSPPPRDEKYEDPELGVAPPPERPAPAPPAQDTER